METKLLEVIAIDGPAGSGKSTVAKEVARKLHYRLVDTGAIYRAVALLAHEAGVAFDDDTCLQRIVADLDITFRLHDGINQVYLEGRDVTDMIRSSRISNLASQVSSRLVVRQGLLQLQQSLASAGKAVLEGRDIGTVVCPQAFVKIFLDASDEERARRRYEEMLTRGEKAEFADVLRDITERDKLDKQRKYAPLVPAPDAFVLDSTTLSLQQVMTLIVALAHEKIDPNGNPMVSKQEVE